jgi:hypothetical protein
VSRGDSYQAGAPEQELLEDPRRAGKQTKKRAEALIATCAFNNPRTPDGAARKIDLI